jgi:hypothetical protein
MTVSGAALRMRLRLRRLCRDRGVVFEKPQALPLAAPFDGAAVEVHFDAGDVSVSEHQPLLPA